MKEISNNELKNDDKNDMKIKEDNSKHLSELKEYKSIGK
jgi:hypothetical protein